MYKPQLRKKKKPHSGKRGLNSLHHNPDFLLLSQRSLLKTLWEKEKILVTSIFSFSHNVFYPSQNKFQFFSHIYFIVYKCFQFGPDKNFVVWYRANASSGSIIQRL